MRIKRALEIRRDARGNLDYNKRVYRIEYKGINRGWASAHKCGFKGQEYLTWNEALKAITRAYKEGRRPDMVRIKAHGRDTSRHHIRATAAE
jgi:hypothetical protein